VGFMKRVCCTLFISLLSIYPSAHNRLREHFSGNQLYYNVCLEKGSETSEQLFVYREGCIKSVHI